MMNFHLDLDSSLVVDALAAALDKKKTRLLNDIIREWLSERYPEMYERLHKESL